MKNMPKTKFQEVVYGILMSAFMVIAMEIYNSAIKFGGMENKCFLNAIKEWIFMCPICFVISFFAMDRIAPRIAFKLVTPGVDKPVFVIVIRAAITVCLMCPTMSLVATLIFRGISVEFVSQWLETLARNFPMALCWQIFFCGPLVRRIFALLFKSQLKKDNESADECIKKLQDDEAHIA